jgi:hypothetical protein
MTPSPGLARPASVPMLLLSLLIFAGYYWLFKDYLGVLARRVARWVPGGTTFTTKELYSLTKTILGISSQALLIIVVLVCFPVTRLAWSHPLAQLAAVPAGVALGLAEMAASIVAAKYVIGMLAVAGRTGRLPGLDVPGQVWVDSSRAGWMGSLVTIRQRLRPLPSALVVWLQVSCEEVMFRQCFPLLIGGLAGLWAGAALFVVMQIFGMPGWRSALFPVIGAVIMGAVHAYVFAHTSLIVPLIVAHGVSFFAATRTRQY